MTRNLAADWYGIDFRKHPELYRVGRGEQGVLTAQPYKAEILPLWRFRTPAIAARSARALRWRYCRYRRANDAVGMDMCRKYVQMGWTRARRYANHRSGKKYAGPVPVALRGISGAHGREILPRDPDPIKARCALYFRRLLDWILTDPAYIAARQTLRK